MNGSHYDSHFSRQETEILGKELALLLAYSGRGRQAGLGSQAPRACLSALTPKAHSLSEKQAAHLHCIVGDSRVTRRGGNGRLETRTTETLYKEEGRRQ